MADEYGKGRGELVLSGVCFKAQRTEGRTGWAARPAGRLNGRLGSGWSAGGGSRSDRGGGYGGVAYTGGDTATLDREIGLTWSITLWSVVKIDFHGGRCD